MKVNQLLQGRHILAGLELDECEDILVLTKYDKPVATFSTKGATLQSILDIADKYLDDENAD